MTTSYTLNVNEMLTSYSMVTFFSQATAVADPNRTQTTKPTNMEVGTTPPPPPPPTQPQKHPTNGVTTLPPPQMRVLTTSNSFDSKSSIPNFCQRFQMSAEATKLFQTLQQSPLPISEVRFF